MNCISSTIKSILHSTQFCGLCLDTIDLSPIDQDLEIIVSQQIHTKALRAIIDVVFNENDSVLASSQICNTCTDKLIQSYIFIENAIETSRMIQSYVDDLFTKTNDIFNHCLDSNSECSNVVIVLENSADNCIGKERTNAKNAEARNDIITTKTTIAPEIKKNNLSEQNQNFVVHNKVQSLTKCKFCKKILKETDLLEHVKKYHEDALLKCLKCNTVFYSIKRLQIHENSCTVEERTQCLKCLKLFTEEELSVHNCWDGCLECSRDPCVHLMYIKHFKEQKLKHLLEPKCLDCDYICRDKTELINHVNRKHLNHYQYSCNKCDEQFYSKAVLKSHILRFHVEYFVCQYCDSEFRNIKVYESHVKCCEDIKRRFACEDCPASFDSSDSLSSHVKLRHSKDIFPCGLCNSKFLEKVERSKHMLKVHKQQKMKSRMVKVECVLCQEKFVNKRDLAQHMKSHSPTQYPCRICNKEFKTLRQFKAHYRKHKGPYATCHVCGEEMRAVLLKRHLTTHTDSIVTCETCGKSFRNTTMLKYHQKVHLDSVPCPKCKKMINPAKLRRHWKGHLINEDPIQRRVKKQQPHLKCNQCDYKTYNNLLLECHINRHHSKIKPYVCHICSKAFIGKHLLKNHIERHKVKSVACMVCLKSFANDACLKMHLRLHTGEKPFTCEVCGDRFRSSSIMNVHKLKKHSEKSIICPLCSNKFHTVRDLRRHVIKVHWKQKNRPFNPREVEGLDKEHYHLFHDGRRVKVEDEEVDIYMPCLPLN